MEFLRKAPSLLVIAFCALPAVCQTQPADAGPCALPQQSAAAMPAPGVQPATAEEGRGETSRPYRGLSNRDKFNVFVQYAYSPYTFAGAAFDAGVAQAVGGWHSYGGGMEGYSKRFGASLADSESGTFFGRFLFPVLLHEDPRYLRSTSTAPLPRIEYALSRVLVTHDDDGNKRPNFSLVLSVFASSGMANLYYPRVDRGPGDTAARAGGDFLSVAEMNLLREFWPDIARKFRKHEPKRIQRLEESPRVAKIEEMVMGPTATAPCPRSQQQPGNH